MLLHFSSTHKGQCQGCTVYSIEENIEHRSFGDNIKRVVDNKGGRNRTDKRETEVKRAKKKCIQGVKVMAKKVCKEQLLAYRYQRSGAKIIIGWGELWFFQPI
jgi:hypothetical protein